MQPTPHTPSRRNFRAIKKKECPANCEHCNVENGIKIKRFRLASGLFPYAQDYLGAEIYQDQKTKQYFIADNSEPLPAEIVIKVEELSDRVFEFQLLLTYLDNNEANTAAYNIRYLCQRCYRRQIAVVRAYREALRRAGITVPTIGKIVPETASKTRQLKIKIVE